MALRTWFAIQELTGLSPFRADGSRRKSVRTLVSAFALVLKKYSHSELRLVGPGLAAVDPIAKWTRLLQLDKVLVFAGSVGLAVPGSMRERPCSVIRPWKNPKARRSSRVSTWGLPVIAGRNSGVVLLSPARRTGIEASRRA